MGNKVKKLYKTNDNMVTIHEASQGQIDVVYLIENTIKDRRMSLYLVSVYKVRNRPDRDVQMSGENAKD